MKLYRQHEDIREFMKQVISHIQSKEVHHEVRMELESHLEDIITEKMERGVELTAAIQEAISQMGAPDIIGAQFHQVHRPRTDWKLLALIAAFMMFGLVAIFAAQASNGFSAIGIKQVVYVCVGGLLMLAISFGNYTKLAKYSWTLYFVTLFMLIFAIVVGTKINGSSGYLSFGRVGINFISLTPYLFLLSLAGIWTSSPARVNTNSRISPLAWSAWSNLGTVLLPSILILKSHSVTDFVLLFSGSMMMLIVLKKTRKIIITHLSLLLGAILFILLKETYLSRWTAFLNPYEDPQGLNYVLTQSKKTITSGGWWGQGFGTPLATLPEIHSNMMFPFLIYCFGWIAGLLMLMMVILFVFHALQLSSKIQDAYGKAMLSGILTLFVIQFIWPMLMALGWAPLTSFTLPFVSYGGTLVIFQFAAIGLILNVYRRKDMIPSYAKIK
ncbi:FtsW/RodA/SpoVE family cell cycle protein [Paenibacillus sp. HWE-109]|uniref:FtsW/RodA/SpoVE family cell cycle protein n=1 Tax=Paenibacillus sp. HWE-109 TaxID=1306526 RepID=UPI001EE0C609|nr:FtsW/RodA/SpoVE family cell cycle protein [Paenibacillus sp. HWE-109]UKS23969.1 FtsW/RodA/SpoVE family cell cycle protein [Paenibacillus sp. HWE-109]